MDTMERIIKNDHQGPDTIYMLPNTCPLCHVSIKPTILLEHLTTEKYSDVPVSLHVLFSCPACNGIFLAAYEYQGYTSGCYGMELKELSPKRHNAYKNDKIQKISSKFVDIYNEAEHAESEGLMEICGMGYRKALEFLIKDYLISLYPNETESIKTELLSKSINRISYDKLKKVATKSAWLGNDQAHYVQKYENRDIDDLKKYIDATVHWILTEYLTNEDL